MSVFDYVIVGAGSAGCVLARRLVDHLSLPSVCLVERGPPNTDARWSIAMPLMQSYNKVSDISRDLFLRYSTAPELHMGISIGFFINYLCLFSSILLFSISALLCFKYPIIE